MEKTKRENKVMGNMNMAVNVPIKGEMTQTAPLSQYIPDLGLFLITTEGEFYTYCMITDTKDPDKYHTFTVDKGEDIILPKDIRGRTIVLQRRKNTD